MTASDKLLEEFMSGLEKRNPHELEFHQAVREVAESIMPWYLDHHAYRTVQILERTTEPDRIVIFAPFASRMWRAGGYTGQAACSRSVPIRVSSLANFLIR